MKNKKIQKQITISENDFSRFVFCAALLEDTIKKLDKNDFQYPLYYKGEERELEKNLYRPLEVVARRAYKSAKKYGKI